MTLQFAFRAHREVEATITLLNLLLKHLDKNGSHARLLFVLFFLSFQHNLTAYFNYKATRRFNLSNNLVGWILNYVTNRTQRVKVKSSFSDKVYSDRLASHQVVFSHLVFTSSTQTCVRVGGITILTIIKYADDSVIVSLPQDSETGHGSVIDDFVKWCEASHLQLNVSKTKDMLTDFREMPHGKKYIN